ncbi:MAG: hypothetical protein VKJ04_11450 [Vampirovibrionales bacterium]|nr:hypothetical protein [Vampirovibrionales bacterium]
MSSAFELQATDRDDTLNPRQLRKAGFLPATIYGKGQAAASRSIQVRAYDFTRALYKGHQVYRLVGAGFDGLEVKIQALQTETVSENPLNIEFVELGASQSKKAPAKQAEKAPAKKAAKKPAEPEAEAALASA